LPRQREVNERKYTRMQAPAASASASGWTHHRSELMRRLPSFVTALLILAPAFAQNVQLSLDASEADAALTILRKEAAHVSVDPADWGLSFQPSRTAA
jgi:hypothetical protein